MRPNLELLEQRLTLTGNIAITNAVLVNSSDQAITDISAGEEVYVKAEFTTQNLPTNASYRVAYTVNGVTLDSGYVTYGAGESGTNDWYEYRGYFIASAGVNQVTVDVDPDQSVAETTYADNTMSFSFTAASTPVGNLSYTVSQIRAAYGINSIPDFGSATADGTGQTIAVVDAYNDPSILTDLDGFDEAMNLSTNSSPTLYQQYGPASSILTVYNQAGTNITSEIADSGEGGVPAVDSTGAWELEETLDVEWAHAIAPGAKIDLIECNSNDTLLTGAATAASLPAVTVVSMSWIYSEFAGEVADDSSIFVTPSGHPGITFLASTGDGGTPGGYPAFSPNVVAVGATQLTVSSGAYGSETAWSFPTPNPLENGSAAYSQTGTWTSESGGFSGSYGVAPADSNSSATWTTSITSSDQGWSDGTEVSATWVASAGNATNATYTIYDGTAATGTVLGTVTVNQTEAPVGTSDGNTQFQELGDYYPKSGTLTVVLNAQSANGTVVADAVGIAPAWATAGGQSQYETEPSYQLSVQTTGYRTTPDVTFDGSDSSGVTCYQNGAIEYDYFGTSLAAPCWAGLIAIVDQGRLAEGGTSFNSTANPQQTLEALYSLPASDFNEVTTGYNGLSAGPGYNELTGLGTPIANLLVPDLVSYGIATQLQIATPPPAVVTAGDAFELTVDVEDSSGNVLTTYDGTVTIDLSTDPGSGTLDGTLTATVVNGIATFSGLTLDTVGDGYVIEAIDETLTSAMSNGITVNPAGAYQLVIHTLPSSSDTAGMAFTTQPVIYEEDQYGNLETADTSTMVTAALESGTGPLLGTLTATLTDGVATFTNLADDMAETISLEFTSGDLASATSGNIVVSPATAYQLIIHTQPSSTAMAGQAFAIQPVIYEEDRYGNLERADTSTAVTAALESGAGPLEGTLTATVSGGVATFTNLADDTAETISLEFTGVNLASATSNNIVVSAPAYKLVIQTQPSSTATAGQAFATHAVIYEEDQYGNLVTADYTTVVTAALESGTGPLQGTLTATVSGGVATFTNLADDTAETISLAFTSGNLVLATSNSIVVSPAAAYKLVIHTQASSTATAGQAFGTQPVIDEEDQYNNLETADNTTVVTAALESGTGPLQGTPAATVSRGVATFTNLADDTAETISLAFTSGNLLLATSNNIVVSPAAAYKLVIHTQASATATAGQAFGTQPVIDEEDQYNNLETADNTTVVTAALESGAGPLQGTPAATVSRGVATFTNLADDTAETISLAFMSGNLLLATSNNIVVSPAAAYKLVIHTQASATATAGQAFGTQPVIDEEDQYNNLETADNTTVVTAALESGSGPLQGTPTATVLGGVATFRNLADDTAEMISLKFTSGNLVLATSNNIVVSPAAAYKLVIHTQASTTATAGEAFATQPVIDEEDEYNNLETADNTTVVTAEMNTGIGPIEGTPTARVAGGVATFTNLADDTAETISLAFTSGNLVLATSNNIVVSPAATYKLVIHSPLTSTATAGQAFATQPVIDEEDQYNNLETADNSTVVTAALESGTGPLQGTPTATVSGGVATFTSLADDMAETISLAFTSGNLVLATSNNIVVSPAAAYKLVIHTQASTTATAGEAFATQPVIDEEDQYNNLETADNTTVVTAALESGTGPLQGTPTATVSGGVATFRNLADDTAEMISLKFTSGNLVLATSNNIVVSPAAAYKLVIHTQASTTATAGEAFATQPVIDEEDQYNNLETADNTTVVTAALESGTGPLQGTPTATVLGGVATFSNLADDTAEMISLKFTSGNLVLATSNNIVVSPAAAYKLVIHTQASTTATAGEAFATQPVIDEEDEYNNLETADNTTVVTAALESGTGPLQGTPTATVLGGVATFSNLADDTAETISLAFTSGNLVLATSNNIVVSPAAAFKLVIHTQASSTAMAGQAFAAQPVIDEEDQYNNLETADNTTVVTAALESGTGPLQGTPTATVLGGVATFSNLADDTAETISLAFTSGNLVLATSNNIVVSPAAAFKLVIHTQASSTAMAGQAFAAQPVIDEEDQYNNLETADNTTVVTAEMNTGTGPLQGTPTATVSGGVATFAGLADDTAETISLVFTSGNLVIATSNNLVVSPAAAFKLVIHTQASSTATAGQAFAAQPVIDEEDQYNNLETADNTTVVTAEMNTGTGPLQGTPTATVSGGVATFAGLADDTAGTISLAFTSGNLTPAIANTVTIAPASAAKLVVTNPPPSRVTAGDGFGLDVTAEDRFGNIVPSFTGRVAVALANNPGGGTLNGTLTVTAVNGAASFTGLTLDTAAESDTLQTSAAGLTAAVTSAINVAPASATQLVVTSQPPASVALDSGFGLAVTAEDHFGNVVTSEAGSVAVALTTGSGGSLAGPSTASFVNGVATFTGLTLNGAGGYALAISGNGLAAAVSSSFNVPAPPTIIGKEVLMSGKGKHKKPIGFELLFSAALDPSRAENAANYTVTQTVKHGHKTSAKPVAIHVVYSPSANSVSLIWAGKAPFTKGGQIVVNASSSSGLTDTSGTALDGNDEGAPGDNAVLTVLPKARGVVG